MPCTTITYLAHIYINHADSTPRLAASSLIVRGRELQLQMKRRRGGKDDESKHIQVLLAVG